MVTANGPASSQVFVELEIEMPVHTYGADRERSLVVEGITAATTQGQIGIGGVNSFPLSLVIFEMIDFPARFIGQGSVPQQEKR